MRTSPLQLLRYFVPEISCTANKEFDSEKDIEFSPDQFVVRPEISRTSDSNDGEDPWTVEMTIHQQIGPEQNFPYEFKLVIVGIFACGNTLPAGVSKETFVRVNGYSILYGVAREMIRATTARGPWSDLMVPTLSFYEPPSVKQAEAVVE